MAITNAQQYQQLVNKPANGKRPGYRGDDAARSSEGTKGGRADPGKSGRGDTRGDIGNDRSSGADDRSSALQTYNTKKATGKLGRQDPMGGELQYRNGVLIDETGRPVDDTFRGGFTGDLTEEEKTLETFIDSKADYPKYTPAYVKFLANLNRQPNRKYFVENVLRAGKIPRVDYSMLGEDEFDIEQAYEDYMSNRLSGKTDAMGNPTQGFSYNDGVLTGNFIDNDGGGDQPYVPSTTTPSDDIVDDRSELQKLIDQRGIAYRFMADGGMTNDAPVEGGIMDLESGRQMYFLGKLVKKATRAVKKIAKSPIGKAALLYAGGSFLGGGGGGITGIFGKDAFLRKTLLPKLYKDGAMTGLGKIALGGALTAAPLLFQEEEEEPDYASNRGPGLDIDYIRRNPYETMGGAYRFYAEGGDVEPVAKKTMPLLDMDGKEMDLRADGGFVPIGRMERADDVPARLSKNEFVFTADAVRNAGEGDIDKGAEVMYNMMKNLESGGEVSEESQGLDGAREMFQTSQRLEEVL
jgi:hypothetical protein